MMQLLFWLRFPFLVWASRRGSDSLAVPHCVQMGAAPVGQLYHLPPLLAQTGCWGLLWGGQETPVSYRPKHKASCIPESEPSGTHLRGNIRQTLFFCVHPLLPSPKARTLAPRLYSHLMVFPVSPLPADTLSVPRWSPQIPRRDLGNSIKHRYAEPAAALAGSLQCWGTSISLSISGPGWGAWGGCPHFPCWAALS